MRDEPKAGFAMSGGFPLAPLLFLAVIFFLNFTGRIILSPLLTSVESDLRLNHGQSGALFFTITLGYFVSILGSGFVSAKIAHKGNIVVSSVCQGLCLVALAFATSLWQVALALLFVGLSAGLYLPSGIAALTLATPPRHWGKALSVHELAPNLSFAAAPLMAGYLSLRFGWRGAFAFLGVLCILFGLAFQLFSRVGGTKGSMPAPSALLALLKSRHIHAMIALFSLGIAGTLGVYAMLPLFLEKARGIPVHRVNDLVAASRVLPVFAALGSGFVADRLGSARTMALALFFSGCGMLAVGAFSGWAMIAGVIVQPIFAVGFFPAGFAALAAVGDERSRGLAVSVTIPLAFLLGGGALPWLIGVLGEHGHFGLGFMGSGAACCACALLLAPRPGGNG
ncbi:MAG: MFS transporter [Thermodesulfobacteriota bacterium]